MDLPYATTTHRDRYPSKPDPYNSESQIIDYNGTPSTITLEGYVASSSSTSSRDATRSQILTSKSLFLTDVTADVRVGDRIRSQGHEYRIDALPESDVNPFTGWQPYVEIPLEEVIG